MPFSYTKLVDTFHKIIGLVMKRSIIRLLGITLVIFSTFCVHQYLKTEQITITSNVSDAEIFIDGELIGSTPFIGEIRSLSNEITIKKKYFNDSTVQLEPTFLNLFENQTLTNKLVELTQNVSETPIYSISSNNFQIDLEHIALSKDSFTNSVELKKYAIVHFTDIAFDLATNNIKGEHVQHMLRLANRGSNSTTIALVQDYLKEANGSKAEFGKLASRLLVNANGEGC